MINVLGTNPYDYPRFYDFAYGSEWRAETNFLVASFEKHSAFPVRRVFEPACGTGRLLFRLGQAGFDVSGLDLNKRAVAFCNERLRRKGFRAGAAVGDMTNFRLPHKVDAAFNMISSFRHLRSEDAARSHLRGMAEALREGGIYVVGLHLTPTARAPLDTELWSVQRGSLRVRTRVSTVRRDLRRRQERIHVTFDIRTPRTSSQLANRITLRTYTAEQFLRLLSTVEEFEIAAIYDFSYHIGEPIALDRRPKMRCSCCVSDGDLVVQ